MKDGHPPFLFFPASWKAANGIPWLTDLQPLSGDSLLLASLVLPGTEGVEQPQANSGLLEYSSKTASEEPTLLVHIPATSRTTGKQHSVDNRQHLTRTHPHCGDS